MPLNLIGCAKSVKPGLSVSADSIGFSIEIKQRQALLPDASNSLKFFAFLPFFETRDKNGRN